MTLTTIVEMLAMSFTYGFEEIEHHAKMPQPESTSKAG